MEEREDGKAEKDKERIQTVIFSKEGIMSVPDLANMIGIPLLSLKNFIKSHNLHYFKISRIWMVDLNEFWEEAKAIKKK